jgi:glutamyl-tRNA synthetase
MNPSPLVRFAPSPTGRIHVGNVRTALLNALFAKKAGGRFLLRIDDTDAGRSQKAFEEAIVADLAWLGLAHDLFARQSDRLASYAAAADKLRAAERLYPCYETADELERKRRRQLARGQAPVYDRAALKLTAAERAALEAEGRAPHWRFRLEDGMVFWTDLIRGPSGVNLGSVSDPVLVRSDGLFLYTLPSVVDDIELGVTHIIRGEDHVTNTGTQIELFLALGAKPPAFAHHPLLLAADGGPLSKRLGSLSIGELHEEGYEPMAILSLLAKLGTADAPVPRADLTALADEFDFAKIGRAPARFDPAELTALNARLLHETDFASIAPRLAALGIAGEGERLAAFWEAVRANLARFKEAALWWRVVEGPIAPVIEDAEFLAKAAALLPPAPFAEESWGVWTKAMGAATGAKGKGLYHPLRLALTGLEHGPELKKLLVLIGPERAKARLLGQTA